MRLRRHLPPSVPADASFASRSARPDATTFRPGRRPKDGHRVPLHMETIPLTGVQKFRLRSHGQTLEPARKIGKAGFSPASSPLAIWSNSR